MKRLVLPLVALVIGCAGPVHAELTPEQTKAARALITQFSDRRFAVRQQAVDKLVAMGPDVIPLVKEALARTKDAEVKLRCRMTLNGIGKKYGVEVDPGRPPRRFGLDASKVTISRRGASLDDLLEEFAEQSGNAFIEPPEDSEDKRVTLEVEAMPYWQALDVLCRKARLIYQADEHTGAVTLHPEEDALDVCVYAGPVVLRLSLGEYARHAGRGAQVDYHFVFLCEDGLEPDAASIVFTKALGPGGDALRRDQARRQRLVRSRGGCFNGRVSLSFNDLPREIESIDRIEGVARLTFGTGHRTVTVEDVFSPGTKTAEVDGVSLVVFEARHVRNWASVRVRRTLGGRDEPLPLFPVGGRYGLHLVDPNGKRYPGSVRRGGVGDSYVSPKDGGHRHAVFGDLPAIKGKWKLVCVLPTKTTVKAFPFTFKNVPLP